MLNEFIVTATRSMRAYASRVVEYLARFSGFSSFADSLNGIDIVQVDRFADGEIEAVVNTSIRGKAAVLFASCARNEEGTSVADAKIELYHTIDALKRAQAARILVFEPFVSCSRSDRTARRSSVGLWVHLKTLVSLGTSHFVTYHLHSDKSKSMLDPALCAIDDIPALTLIKRYLCDVYIRDIETLEKVVRPRWAFCSVDAGGEKLARGFANAFGAPLVVAHKQRDYSTVNTIKSINILSHEPVEGKALWIVDDMVDTAGSVESMVHVLASLKPAEINILAVHALFSPPAVERLAALARNKLLNRIIVTDTVSSPSPRGLQGVPNLEVVPSAELSAKIVRAIMTNSSMSKLLRTFNAELYLKSPKLFNQWEAGPGGRPQEAEPDGAKQ
ncbi:MAG: ribose-phosphate diphosphokinase [Spirochaetaceae bacterium]|jgi:ribose-phosphate pyrophosphokinase|nr:ribose-phosphate diphosphokinase [Spirochaetaceae bacterium]